ncbi:MAG: abscisic acid-deficient protein Aba4 family protein [Flavobacteriaceae bacterium]
MTSMLFNICNTGILLCWFLLLLFPTSLVSKTIRAYPWVPLALSFAYVYFFRSSGWFGRSRFY